MAKKKTKIELENIELKPQVIGYTYKKKSNLGRVTFIFICFVLVIYYINDISVYINNLLGKNTAETIQNNTTSNKDKEDVPGESKNIVYNVFSEDLAITENNLVLNNFKLADKVLSFDANNNTNTMIDLTNKKYFLEIYTQGKTLLKRMKIDFNNINANSKISLMFDVDSEFYYIAIVEKTIDDYPQPSFTQTNGIINFTCKKGNEEINYNFQDNKLTAIKHTIVDNNINDSDYSSRYLSYQNKVREYNNLNGVNAAFDGTVNGFKVTISIALSSLEEKLSEKYYFQSETTPRIVNFEMETYGFKCQQ